MNIYCRVVYAWTYCLCAVKAVESSLYYTVYAQYYRRYYTERADGTAVLSVCTQQERIKQYICTTEAGGAAVAERTSFLIINSNVCFNFIKNVQ